MAKTAFNMQEWIGEGFDGFVVPKFITAPNTQITNRAQVLDTANTLSPLMGVESIMCTSTTVLQNEFGPNGEQVKQLESKDSRVRFVGYWLNEVGTDGSNVYLPAAQAVDPANFVEITFYGTGLNLLSRGPGNAPVVVFTQTRDGVSATNVTLGAGLWTAVLAGRNTKTNEIYTVASGLTLGWHTVKLSGTVGNTDIMRVHGFQVLNESTSITITPGSAFVGGKKQTLNSAASTAYNAGISGTTGARVLKYLKDGAISQVVTEVPVSASYGASASHANEDLLRKFGGREFGTANSTDFSVVSGGANGDRFWVLEDGTTSLWGNSITVAGSYSTPTQDTMIQISAGTSNYLQAEFIGTGVDVILDSDNNAARTVQILVDGVAALTINTAFYGNKAFKIASGLPYGTHIVRIVNLSGAAAAPGFIGFVTYQPKKPTLPAEAHQVADYCVLANFNAATATTTTAAGNYEMPQGTIAFEATRTWTYAQGVGTWSLVNNTSQNNPQVAQITGGASSTDLLFFGTGVNVHVRDVNTGATMTLQIDGVSNATGTNLVNMANSGGGLYTLTTLNGGQPARVTISGLALGWHRLKVIRQSGTLMVVRANVITPIHVNDQSYKKSFNSLALPTSFDPSLKAPTQGVDLSKAKAFGTFNPTQDGISLGYNVAGALLQANGIVYIFFKKPFKNRNYTCVIGGDSFSTQLQSNQGKKENYIILESRNVSGTLSTQFEYQFACFGELVDE